MRDSTYGGKGTDMAGKTPLALVNPALLTWARESIGLTHTAAATKASVEAARLAAWEAGEARPTIAQLRNLARVYKRPLAVFYLVEPPRGWDAMRDFRQLPDSAPSRWSPELHGEFRRANEQREAALELLALLGEEPPSAWLVSASDDRALASASRARLREASLLSSPASSQGYARFAYWATALEQAGVLVLTSDGVDLAEMRGFSIHEEPMPVVMVNGKDSFNGRIFSVLHEYAHLLLRSGGLCDQRVPERPSRPDRRLEARCNAMAAAILMPAEEVLRDRVVAAAPEDFGGWTETSIRELAGRFGVSGEAVLRRLVDLGKASRSLYEERRAAWLDLYAEQEERRSAPSGNYYRTHVRNLGKGYVRLVMDAHTGRAIDSYTAASYLDAKVSSLPGLGEAARAIREA